jgi:hypothetical protein
MDNFIAQYLTVISYIILIKPLSSLIILYQGINVHSNQLRL